MNEPSLIHHHISPISLYIKVFAALMVLTAVTVGVAYVDLGLLNVFVAITIAVTKACLVAWFFMHLSHSAKITWIAAAGGAIWLIIMISLTMSDYAARGWIPFPPAWR